MSVASMSMTGPDCWRSGGLPGISRLPGQCYLGRGGSAYSQANLGMASRLGCRPDALPSMSTSVPQLRTFSSPSFVLGGTHSIGRNSSFDRAGLASSDESKPATALRYHRGSRGASSGGGFFATPESTAREAFRQASQTAAAGFGACFSSSRRSSLADKAPGTAPARSHAVWDKYGVRVPGYKEREDVLERDRERARVECNFGNARNIASPARSHGASLFFAGIPDGGVSCNRLPGAFQQVARPATRQFVQAGVEAGRLPPLLSSGERGGGFGRSVLSFTNAVQNQDDIVGSSNKTAPLSNSSLEPADTLFEHLEMTDLNAVLESLTLLVRPPGGEVDILFDLQFRDAKEEAIRRSGGKGLSESDANALLVEVTQQGALLLRPLFCRMMLASRVCESVSPDPFNYHECVANFDRHATLFGSFLGMPSSRVCSVIANIYRRGVKKNPREDVTVMEGVERFFQIHLPLVQSHCDERHSRLEHIRATVVAEHSDATAIQQDLEGAKSVNEECQSEMPLWPPLPPKGLDDVVLDEWFDNVRDWQTDFANQSPPRLLALRAHTESVIWGEILAGQLLEPEVLHFTKRFWPLFRNLFLAYYDWPLLGEVGGVPKAEFLPLSRSRQDRLHSSSASLGRPLSALAEEPEEDVDGLEADEAGGGLDVGSTGSGGDVAGEIGHMSLETFFQFCVDFGLFPDHVNLEEIRSIYHDAEAVQRQPDAEALPEVGVVPVEEKRLNTARSHTPSRGRTPSKAASFAASVRPSAAASVRSTAGPKKSKVVPFARAAAVSAAESLTPVVDLRFFDKPLALMSLLETKTLAYFAAVSEWLGQRFVRLSDVLPECCMDPESQRAFDEFVGAAAEKEALRVLYVLPDGRIDQDAMSAGMLAEGQRFFGFRNETEEQEAVKAAKKQALAARAAAMADSPRPTFVNPYGLLSITKSMRAAGMPTEAELEDMFRLLLSGPDENGRWGTNLGVEPDDSEENQLSVGAMLIPVFQLDKVLGRAREVVDGARRWSCSLLCTLQERIRRDEKVLFDFFESLSDILSARMQWSQHGRIEDIFADLDACHEFTPLMLIQKAEELGVPSQRIPDLEVLTDLLADIIGSREAPLDGCIVYRAIAFMQEGRRREKQAVLSSRLRCLTRIREVPTEFVAASGREGVGARPHTGGIIFGLTAFVECLLKITLHRLGLKGRSEIQRGSPAWWKCTWLLTLLTSQFADKVRAMQYEEGILKLATRGDSEWHEAFNHMSGSGLHSYNAAHSWLTETRLKHSRSSACSDCSKTTTDSPSSRTAGARARKSITDPGSARRKPKKKSDVADRRPKHDPDVWWSKLHRGMLLGHLAHQIHPMEWLALDRPDLFDPAQCEAKVGKDVDPFCEVCVRCGERRSASGWGNPSCADCGCVDSECLPIQKHPFGALLGRSIFEPLDR